MALPPPATIRVEEDIDTTRVEDQRPGWLIQWFHQDLLCRGGHPSLLHIMSSSIPRSNTHVIRQAILNHRSRSESDTIMYLQESINFHRSLLYLRPQDFSNSSLVSVQDDHPVNRLDCQDDEEKEDQRKAAEKERSRRRKKIIKELRTELANLKRRVDKNNKIERAKSRTSVAGANDVS